MIKKLGFCRAVSTAYRVLLVEDGMGQTIENVCNYLSYSVLISFIFLPLFLV